MRKLSHLDKQGRARMVDVSAKRTSLRRASAACTVRISAQHVKAIANHPKGDVLTIAEIAGIQAAKRTAEIIPLCHNIPLLDVSVKAELRDGGIWITAETAADAKTGVEMEALTAVMAAALTVYDMLKGAGHGIIIQDVHLVEKTGGKSNYRANELAAVDKPKRSREQPS